MSLCRSQEIYGELENGWEEFQKDIEYEAFLVKLKVD